MPPSIPLCQMYDLLLMWELFASKLPIASSKDWLTLANWGTQCKPRCSDAQNIFEYDVSQLSSKHFTVGIIIHNIKQQLQYVTALQIATAFNTHNTHYLQRYSQLLQKQQQAWCWDATYVITMYNVQISYCYISLMTSKPCSRTTATCRMNHMFYQR